MKIAIGNDHAATALKFQLVEYLKNKNIEVVNYGTDETSSCDYPDFALKVCEDVINNKVDYGILICYTGIGMSIAANKVTGVRAALVQSVENAHLTKEHNNSNVLCMGAKDVTFDLACKIIDEFLNTPFSHGERHERRVEKVLEIEKKYAK